MIVYERLFQYVFFTYIMQCPFCKGKEFKEISLYSRNIWEGHRNGEPEHIVASAKITNREDGNLELFSKDRHFNGLVWVEGIHEKDGVLLGTEDWARWVPIPKACMKCGFIAMFLGFEELDNKVTSD